ncbi:MAG: hypothetical protein M1829_000019 [Trizodia sp. TS-e1964]|nr:MAG: hypothetical protein M1829_000019 [Trizodia sp. TS-e1964]
MQTPSLVLLLALALAASAAPILPAMQADAVPARGINRPVLAPGTNADANTVFGDSAMVPRLGKPVAALSPETQELIKEQLEFLRAKRVANLNAGRTSLPTSPESRLPSNRLPAGRGPELPTGHPTLRASTGDRVYVAGSGLKGSPSTDPLGTIHGSEELARLPDSSNNRGYPGLVSPSRIPGTGLDPTPEELRGPTVIGKSLAPKGVPTLDRASYI